MRVIGVIPARGGSQRLPGKNLLPMLGKPLIAYTIEAALQASTLDRVLVSTDHEEIAATARTFGAEVVMRPAELATAEAALDDSLRHVVDHLSAGEGFSTGVVVSMQANNPVRKRGEIDEAVRKLRATPWATAVASAYEISERPEWAKVVSDPASMEIRPFMVADSNFRKQDLRTLYLLDGSIIAVRADVLKRTAGDRRVHAFLGERVTILSHEKQYAVEIDCPEDVGLAKFYLSADPG